MASEIVLLPVDAPVPEEAPETPSTAPETPDDAIPTKRGRGRPPGARNKPKTTTVEPVEIKRKKKTPNSPTGRVGRGGRTYSAPSGEAKGQEAPSTPTQRV